MKAYLIRIFVIDHDGVGAEDMAAVIENARYPNRCLSPEVKSIQEFDIGEWSDEHPLNQHSTADAEYRRLLDLATPTAETVKGKPDADQT